MDKFSAETENKIKIAAREIFLEKGKDGARMQLIAERAGVNKSLVHYYFRSKEKLYFAVLKDTLKEVVGLLDDLPENTHFRDFLWHFISNHIEFIQENRNLLSFILWELRENPESLPDYIQNTIEEFDFIPQEYIQRRITRAIERGEIRPIHPIHFILNMISMDVFPFLAAPLVKALLEISDEDFARLLEQRKKEVFRLLWNDIKNE